MGAIGGSVEVGEAVEIVIRRQKSEKHRLVESAAKRSGNCGCRVTISLCELAFAIAQTGRKERRRDSEPTSVSIDIESICHQQGYIPLNWHRRAFRAEELQRALGCSCTGRMWWTDNVRPLLDTT